MWSSIFGRPKEPVLQAEPAPVRISPHELRLALRKLSVGLTNDESKRQKEIKEKVASFQSYILKGLLTTSQAYEQAVSLEIELRKSDYSRKLIPKIESLNHRADLICNTKNMETIAKDLEHFGTINYFGLLTEDPGIQEFMRLVRKPFPAVDFYVLIDPCLKGYSFLQRNNKISPELVAFLERHGIRVFMRDREVQFKLESKNVSILASRAPESEEEGLTSPILVGAQPQPLKDIMDIKEQCPRPEPQRPIYPIQSNSLVYPMLESMLFNAPPRHQKAAQTQNIRPTLISQKNSQMLVFPSPKPRLNSEGQSDLLPTVYARDLALLGLQVSHLPKQQRLDPFDLAQLVQQLLLGRNSINFQSNTVKYESGLSRPISQIIIAEDFETRPMHPSGDSYSSSSPADRPQDRHTDRPQERPTDRSQVRPTDRSQGRSKDSPEEESGSAESSEHEKEQLLELQPGSYSQYMRAEQVL